MVIVVSFDVIRFAFSCAHAMRCDEANKQPTGLVGGGFRLIRNGFVCVPFVCEPRIMATTRREHRFSVRVRVISPICRGKGRWREKEI